MSSDDNNYIPYKELFIGVALTIVGSGGLYLSYNSLVADNNENREEEVSVDGPSRSLASIDEGDAFIEERIIKDDPLALEIVDGQISTAIDDYYEESTENEEENSLLGSQGRSVANAPNTEAFAPNEVPATNTRKRPKLPGPKQEHFRDDECSVNCQGAPLPTPVAEATPAPEDNGDTEDDLPPPPPPIIGQHIPLVGPGLQCYMNRAQGIYVGLTSIEIGCSENAAISYCLSSTSTPCDPLTTPTVYSGAFNVGPADGIYSLSFYGVSTGTSEATSVYQKRLIINSGALSMDSDFKRLNLQTSELPILFDTTSVSFGSSDHFYKYVNLHGNNPGIEGSDSTCAQIFNEYSSFRAPASIELENSLDVSGLTSGDTIEQPIDHHQLVNGNNFLTSFVEDRANSRVVCHFEKVVLRDFPYGGFSSGGTTSIVANVRTTMGHFVGYGHFQATANTTAFGSSENTKSQTSLIDDLIGVFY